MGDWLTEPTFPCPIEVYLFAGAGSRQTDSSYYDDVSYTFSQPVSPPEGYSLYITLLSATIPHTFRVINEYNDSVTIDGTVYSIPRGNHSISTLVAALRTALPPDISVTWDSISLQITLQ